MSSKETQNEDSVNTGASTAGRVSKSQKRQMRQEAAQSKTMVRRSTLYVSVFFALVLGLYIGMLLQDFNSAGITKPSGTTNTTSHIAELEAEVKNNPANAEAWIHLGNVQYDANNPMEAIKAYEAALKIKPNDPNVLTDLGTMYRKVKKFDLALERYYTAQRLNPMHKNSFFNAGIVLYYDLDKKAEGKKMFEKVLNIDPNAKAPNGQSLKEMLREM